MKVQFECPEHGWEDVELGDRGFVIMVDPMSDPEATLSKISGAEHPWTQVFWGNGDDVHSVEWGNVPDFEGRRLGPDGVTANGRSKTDDMLDVGVEPGPTDEELDAWLDAKFGVEPAAMKPYKPRVGHKFNLAFARDLIAFGRSFT